MTTTIDTQALENYKRAAGEILDLLDDLGFTTDKGFDPADLKERIAGIIVLSTKVSCGEIIDAEMAEQEPTDEDIEQMLKELREEDEAQYNICPECGNLMSR